MEFGVWESGGRVSQSKACIKYSTEQNLKVECHLALKTELFNYLSDLELGIIEQLIQFRRLGWVCLI